MSDLGINLIKWRIGPFNKVVGAYQLLAYIDARTAMTELDRLDPEWETIEPKPVYEGDKVVAFIHGIRVKGVTRYDIGAVTSIEPHKGGVSDALKRTAQTFGIGRELYDQPQVFVPDRDFAGRPTFNETTGRWEIAAPAWVVYPSDPDQRALKSEVKELVKSMGLSKSEVEAINGGPLGDSTDLERLLTRLYAHRAGGEAIE